MSFLVLKSFLGLALLAAPLAGLFLVIKGWLGHRVGNQPSCSKCGYDITGLPSTICPECGTDLQKAGIVFGVHRRRAGMIIAGLLLIIPVIALLVAGMHRMAGKIDWYKLKSTESVISDISNNNIRTAIKAYRELNRRLVNRSFTDSQCAAAANAAISDLTQTPKRGLASLHIDLLDGLRKQGRLTDQQKKQYLEGLSTVTMQSRSEALRSIGIPIRFTFSADTGSTQLWCDFKMLNISVTGEPLFQDQDYKISRCRSGGTVVKNYTHKVSRPGHYELSAKLRVGVYEGTAFDESQSTLLHEYEVRSTARCNVIDQARSNLVTLLKKPDLMNDMLMAIRILGLRVNKKGNNPKIEFQIANPPADLAFKIKIVVGKQTIDAGSLNISKGTASRYRIQTECRLPTVQHVDVILIPDIESAMRSVDLNELWNTPIRFRQVPIAEPKAPDFKYPIEGEIKAITSRPAEAELKQ